MKVKTIFFGLLITAFACSVFFQDGFAISKTKAAEASSSKIGAVSIRKLFMECKKNAKYREQAKAEQDKAIEELQQLRAEIKAAEAALETLKPGSKDYLERVQELAQKRALLPIRQEYYQQQFADKDKQWTEQLYKDTLGFINEVAASKGLDMVFEVDEPEFPIASPDELMLTIRTHKLLYKGNCVDITAEVMAKLDSSS